MATRVGPDQSINDPSVLQNLLGLTRNVHEYLAACKEISDSQDVNLSSFDGDIPKPTSNLITSITIPLALDNGSTQGYGSSYGANKTSALGLADNFQTVAPQSEWTNANINTYANLAERFRSYWSTLNSFLDTLSDFSSITAEGTLAPGITFSGCSTFSTGRKRVSDRTRITTANLIDKIDTSFVFQTLSIPVASFATPDWIGEGPSSYFDTTYPQLRDEIKKLYVTVEQDTLEFFAEEDYETFSTALVSRVPAPTGDGEIKEASLSMGRNQGAGTKIDPIRPSEGTTFVSTTGPEVPAEDFAAKNEWIQIYNQNDIDQIVSFSAVATGVYGNSGFSLVAPRYSLISARYVYYISSINDYVNADVFDQSPAVTSKGSVFDESLAAVTNVSAGAGGEGTGVVSISDSVNIPPGSSLFIRVCAGMEFRKPDLIETAHFGSATLSVTINGVSRTEFYDLGFFGTGC